MALDLSDTLGPVGQQIEDELAALAARINAIQTTPVDLTAIEARLAAIEADVASLKAYDASLKLVRVQDILDAISTAVGDAVAVEAS